MSSNVDWQSSEVYALIADSCQVQDWSALARTSRKFHVAVELVKNSAVGWQSTTLQGLAARDTLWFGRDIASSRRTCFSKRPPAAESLSSLASRLMDCRRYLSIAGKFRDTAKLTIGIESQESYIIAYSISIIDGFFSRGTGSVETVSDAAKACLALNKEVLILQYFVDSMLVIYDMSFILQSCMNETESRILGKASRVCLTTLFDSIDRDVVTMRQKSAQFLSEIHIEKLQSFTRKTVKLMIDDGVHLVLSRLKERTSMRLSYLESLAMTCRRLLPIFEDLQEARNCISGFLTNYMELELSFLSSICSGALEVHSQSLPTLISVVSAESMETEMHSVRQDALAALKSDLSKINIGLDYTERPSMLSEKKLPSPYVLNLNLVADSILFNKDSLRRSLVAHNNNFEAIQQVFKVLLITVLSQILTPLFTKVTITPVNTKTADKLFEFLILAQLTDTALQMIDLYYFETICLFINPEDSFDPVVKVKKSFDKSVDHLIADGLEKGVQATMLQVEMILKTQSIKDYDFTKQKANSQITLTSKSVIEYLESRVSMVAKCTDKHTWGIFAGECASRLFHAIVKNLKRFTITIEGGIQVLTDFNSYYAFVQSLQLPSQEIFELFVVLKELGNVFIVDALDLKRLIHDQQALRFKEALRTEDLLELVALRKDWAKIKGRVETSECTLS